MQRAAGVMVQGFAIAGSIGTLYLQRTRRQHIEPAGAGGVVEVYAYSLRRYTIHY